MSHDANAACAGTVSRSPTLGDLAKRMASVNADLRNLEEAGWNDYHRFSFVSLGQVTEPVRRAMSAAGIVVFPSVTESVTDPWQMKSGTGEKATVTVDFTWVAAESGEWITTRWVGTAIDAGDKAISKAYSQLLKQCLMKTFLVSSAIDEDPDAEAPEKDATSRSRWNRFEAEADIDSLLAHTELDEESLERFRNYLLDSYGVKAWTELTDHRVAQIRHRLREMSVEERRETIRSKAEGVADAA